MLSETSVKSKIRKDVINNLPTFRKIDTPNGYGRKEKIKMCFMTNNIYNKISNLISDFRLLLCV